MLNAKQFAGGMSMTEKGRRTMGIALAVAALCLNDIPMMEGAVRPSFAQTQAAGTQQRMLIPGGQAVGVALKTQGVLVVAKMDNGAIRTPLRVGDVILSVTGEAVSSAAELSERVNQETQDSVELSVLRGGKEMTVQASAPVDEADGRRRLGVWVRDSTAGVGTLSYIDPATGSYGALGHAIVDGDTGDMLEVREGAIMRSRVVGVNRGSVGQAGELRGSFLKENVQIGTLSLNCERGIYGHMDEMPEDLLYPQGLPIAPRSEVHPGEATIISTVDGDGPKEYRVEIVRSFLKSDNGGKDMILRVKDPALIEKTGGIVQGMSGSPIIQDGKLVGAVTHVLVNDPTRGYGIFIENMLEAAE